MDNSTVHTSVFNQRTMAPKLLSRSAYNVLAVYTGFLVIAGVFNNGLVLFLFMKFKNLRKPVNYLLINLSCSDMAVSLFATPLTFASNVAGRWLFGQIGCSIYAFFVMIVGFEQIVALAAISIHRYFMVARPFTAKKMTTPWAKLFIAITWLYSFILAVPPALGWNEYVQESVGTACAISWTNRKQGNISYVIFIFVMAFAVPLVVIIASYGMLIVTVKKKGRSEAAHSSEGQAESRVTKRVLIMIALYLFAWGPYAGLALYLAFGNEAKVTPLLETLPPFFAKACVVYNSFVYFALNRQFRDAFFRMFNKPSVEPDPNGQRNNRMFFTVPRSSRQRTFSESTDLSELPSTQQPKTAVPAGTVKTAAQEPLPVCPHTSLPGQTAGMVHE